MTQLQSSNEVATSNAGPVEGDTSTSIVNGSDSDMSQADQPTRVAYIFQDNPIVDIASLPADDDQLWKAASMTAKEIIDLAQGTTFKIFAVTPDGEEHIVSEALPAAMLRAFSTAIDGGMWSSLCGDEKAYGIRIHVTHVESMIALLDFMKRTVSEDKGVIKALGRVETAPFYTYYRRAQAAQSLGLKPVQKEMVNRIKYMLYQGDGRPWGPQLIGLELIYEHLRPDHWVRRCISKSLAQANVDRVLRDEAKIEKYLKAHPDIFKEVMVFVDRERNKNKRAGL